MELGRIRGAVASRAEEIYESLDDEQREATRQLFLRLVNVGRDSDTRRVVAASELITLDVDIVTMHAAVEAFVANRLARPRSRRVRLVHSLWRSPTRRCSAEWERLRQWIDAGRDDLRHTPPTPSPSTNG